MTPRPVTSAAARPMAKSPFVLLFCYLVLMGIMSVAISIILISFLFALTAFANRGIGITEKSNRIAGDYYKKARNVLFYLKANRYLLYAQY